MVKVNEIVNYLKEKYPLEFASSFDQGKVGLQFGSMNAEVKKVMIALDGTSNVVKEAINEDVQLLITHHPFMFSPMLSLNYDSPNGQKMINVFKNKLNIFAMHTNYDVAFGGMNDLLAEKLKLKNISGLSDVPSSDNFIRYGEIETKTLEEFANEVKNIFNLGMVRVVGKLDKKISKVGIAGGSGTSELFKAIHLGCDAFVTGEIKQNHAIDAMENGISLIEVPHFVESVFKEAIKDELQEQFKEVEFVLSLQDKDPFIVIK